VKKLLLSTLCYGPEYAGLFCGPYLTALLDPSNLPAVKDRVAFELYTDEATLHNIRQSMQFHRLQQLVPCMAYVLPPSAYENRYQLQADTLGPALKHAHEMDAALMSFNADQCMAKGLLPKVLKALDDGYGGIAAMPFRSTAEHVRGFLTQKAYDAGELFDLMLPAMHPIWIANHWDNPCFSNVPYQLCWSDPEQMVLRMTAVNLLAVVPTEPMLSAAGCPDMVLWPHAKNVLMATDWAQFPVCAVEPLHCFWPAWTVGKHATPHSWLEFANSAGLHDSLTNLSYAWTFKHPTRLPSKESTEHLLDRSSKTVETILTLAGATVASVA
jgi:hypothetical protein